MSGKGVQARRRQGNARDKIPLAGDPDWSRINHAHKVSSKRKDQSPKFLKFNPDNLPRMGI
jgi:hypothetical protein